MNSRRQFQMERIKSRIRECEADRDWLLTMLTKTQVNLAWISERLSQNDKDLRLLTRDLRNLEKRESEESA